MKNSLFSLLLLCLFACAQPGPKPEPTSSPATPAKSTPRVTPTPTPSAVASKPFAGKLLKEVKFEGFYDQYLAFSPDGRYLVSWLPEHIEVYQVPELNPVGRVDKGREPLAISADGKTFYTVGEGGLEAWALPGLKPLSKTDKPAEAAKDGCWKTLSFPKSKVLAGNLGRSIGWAPGKRKYPVSPYTSFYSHQANLIAYSTGGGVSLVDPADVTNEWKSPTLGRSVTSVVVSDDKSWAVTGAMNGAVGVVSLGDKSTGQLRLPGEIRCVAIGGDNRTVAFGCGDGMSEVALIDLAASKLLGTVKPGYGNTWAVAITKDSKILATGSDDGKLRLWQIY